MATFEEKKARMQEIANRGLQDKLPPEKRAIFDEAIKRGIISLPAGQVPTSQVASEAQSIDSDQVTIDIPQVMSFIKGLGQVGSRMAMDLPVKVASGAAGISKSVDDGLLAGAETVKKLQKEALPEVGKEGQEIVGGIASGIKELSNIKGIDKIVEGSKTFSDFLGKIGGATGAYLQDPITTMESLSETGEIPISTGAGVGEAIFKAAPETALTAASLISPLKSPSSLTASSINKFASESAKTTKKLLSEAVPNVSQLKSTAREIYSTIDNLGVTVKQKAFSDFANKTLQSLEKKGLDPDITPKAYAAISRILKESESPITVGKIDTLRQVASNAAKAIEGTDKALGVAIIDNIDDFLTNLKPIMTIGGDSSKVGGMFKSARDLWARAKKSEIIEEAIEGAKDQASGFENGLRVQFRQLLKNKKKMRGFTKQEKDAIAEVVRGTKGANLARQLGKFGIDLNQNTNALGAALGAGAGGVYGGGVGAVVVPVIGSVSRNLAEKLTKQNAKFAQDIVRAGKDGQMIVNAYLKNTPKESRSVAELTELLIRPGVNTKLIKSSNEIARDASYFADNFTPEQIVSALGITTASSKDLVSEASQESDQ